MTSDLNTPLPVLLQTYLHRWEVEVNFRDEKTVLGLGEAQVWHPNAVERAPAFVAASYGALLMASLEAFGTKRTEDYLALPRWRNAPPQRPSTNDLLNQLRHDVWIAYPPQGHSPPENEWLSSPTRGAHALTAARR